MNKQKLTVLPVGAKGPNKIIMKHKGFLSEKKKKKNTEVSHSIQVHIYLLVLPE